MKLQKIVFPYPSKETPKTSFDLIILTVYDSVYSKVKNKWYKEHL